jgi:long-chain acyl-CoA synthetase
MTRVGDFSSLGDLPAAMAAAFGDAPALGVAGRPDPRLTFRDLADRSAAAAAALSARGVLPGDRVVLSAPGSPEWTAALFGVWRAGAVAVPLPVETPAERLAAVVTATGAKLVAADAGQAGPAAGGAEVTSPGALVAARRGGAPGARVFRDDLAVLAFTSGTTQHPRAVELTHANLLGNLGGLLALRTAPPGSKFLSLLPPAHLFELVVGHLGPLACGAEVVYFPGPPLPNRVVEALRTERISHLVAVPGLVAALGSVLVPHAAAAAGLPHLVAAGAPIDLAARLGEPGREAERDAFAGAVRSRVGQAFTTLVVGGAACPATWARLARQCGVCCEVGYGLTEASPVVTLGDSATCPPGSVGKALPGVKVRIAPDGEVLVAGPGVTRGYRGGDPGEPAVHDGGWLHTGDLGDLNPDGFLFIHGRLKEAMVTADGETIYPEEIEPHYQSERFAEWCVVPFPEPDGNDRPVLCVVPAEGADREAVERDFRALRANAPARLRVQGLTVVGSLPRNPLGKVRRRELGRQLQVPAVTT